MKKELMKMTSQLVIRPVLLVSKRCLLTILIFLCNYCSDKQLSKVNCFSVPEECFSRLEETVVNDVAVGRQQKKLQII